MPKAATPLNIRNLVSRFSYDPETGKLFSRSRQKVVGRMDRQGYVSIDVATGKGLRRTILAHRVAFCIVTGADVPEGMFIDHINRNKSDNRWHNLRLVTHRQNMMNASQPRTKNTLPVGVAPNPRSKKNPFIAKIQIRGRAIYLGSFPTPELARQAYLKAHSEAWDDTPA